MDKLVKLSAIEKMAKPMEEYHKNDEEYKDGEGNHEGCRCSCCGSPCDVCSESDSEEYEEEDNEED